MKLYGEWNPEEGTWTVTGLPALALFALTGSYWIVPEWLFCATPGKWGCDLKVVGLDGQGCSFVQSLKRNLLRPLDGLGLYLIGFIAAKLNQKNQRLGDQWAGTVVVTTESLHPPRATSPLQPGHTGETAKLEK